MKDEKPRDLMDPGDRNGPGAPLLVGSLDGASDLHRLLAAVEFAAHKHRVQRRRDVEASPYINHPIQVAHVLTHVGGIDDVVTLMGGVLHDTIEDTETTPEELEERFGSIVRAVVEEVTDDKELPKDERKRLQVERAPVLSDRAKLIKLGDKICNVQDVTYRPPKKWDDDQRRSYIEWTRDVVAGCRGVNPALESFYDRVVEQGLRLLATRGDRDTE
jgi:guanosine-3',5'-bis(diphosphate) 3'-pyrophosphohydrolase